MSQIFDALQRAEGECSGKEWSGEANAADVLKRAEQRYLASSDNAGNTAFSPNGKERAQEERYPERWDRRPLLVTTHSISTPEPDVFKKFHALKSSLDSTSKLISVTQPESAGAEAFRLLTIRLNDFKQSRRMKRVLVTSSIPQEGKSLVAGNLACSLARSDQQRTILIEGDLRRPTLCSLLGVETSNGLAEYLEGKCAIAEAIYFVESVGVWLLPAGHSTANPQDLMKSERLALLIDEVSTWFEWVVIDSPPVLPLADTSVWMRIADGILLTARQGKTVKKALKSCVEALETEKIIGAVLNSARIPEHADYYYGPRSTEQ